MAESAPRLVLLSPHGIDPARAAELGPRFEAACAAGDVAAFVLRLAPGDERGLVNAVKALAPALQARGAAVTIAVPDPRCDVASVAARGGADGVHADGAAEAGLRDLRDRLREGRILGAGGVLASKHEAMAAGEAGVDYLLFGGLRPDGSAPDPERVRERAAWWAEIFETPCVAVACDVEDVAGLAGTGAEFVGLESAIWLDAPERVAAAQALLDPVGPAR